jgi:hypothetical protein
MSLPLVLLNYFRRFLSGTTQAVTRLVGVVHRPSVAFESLKEDRGWVYAFGIVSIVQFSLFLVKEGKNISEGESFILFATIMLAIVLIRNLIVWSFFALLLNFCLQLFTSGKENVSFANVLSIVVHSQIIFLIGSSAAVSVSLLRWIVGITPVFSVTPLVGLSAADWIISLPQPIAAFLRGLDFFAIWFLMVTSQGLKTMYGLKRMRSFLIILTCYCLLLIMKLLFGHAWTTYIKMTAT